jgi:fibronectin type 3 domain-containing protein
VPLSWGAVTSLLTGYNVYYDQSGKLQFVATVPGDTTSYTDRQLKQKTQYCYVVTAVNQPAVT